MTIKRIDFFDFLFGGGRGVRKDQVDWAVDDGDADVYVQSLASSLLPAGNTARNQLKWNNTTSSWEPFSTEDTWYFALTVDAAMQPIAEALHDALLNGFNDRLQYRNIDTHYNPALAEVVLSRYSTPRYNINGDYLDRDDWESNEPAAYTVFNVDTVYSWIILPADTYREAILNRYWSIEPLPAIRNGPTGTLLSGAWNQVNQNLIINGVEYLLARARIEWEPGGTSHNFDVVYTPELDVATVVWITP